MFNIYKLVRTMKTKHEYFFNVALKIKVFTNLDSKRSFEKLGSCRFQKWSEICSGEVQKFIKIFSSMFKDVF